MQQILGELASQDSMDLANPLMSTVMVIQETEMGTNLKVDAPEIGSSKLGVLSQGPILLLGGCLPIRLEYM